MAYCLFLVFFYFFLSFFYMHLALFFFFFLLFQLLSYFYLSYTHMGDKTTRQDKKIGVWMSLSSHRFQITSELISHLFLLFYTQQLKNSNWDKTTKETKLKVFRAHHLLKNLKNINWAYLLLIRIFKELLKLKFYITRNSSSTWTF